MCGDAWSLFDGSGAKPELSIYDAHGRVKKRTRIKFAYFSARGVDCYCLGGNRLWEIRKYGRRVIDYYSKLSQKIFKTPGS